MDIRNIVLVHGAFADATGWGKTILLLEDQKFTVRAAQLPLTSFSEDVASVRRLLAKLQGPTLLVGHSYGGGVITEAGNAPNVAALAYVAAFAPDDGQSVLDLLPEVGGPGAGFIEGIGDDFSIITYAKYHDNFCQDVDSETARIMAAGQKPISGDSFSKSRPKPAAWKSKPVSYLISDKDRMIKPEGQKKMAERMKASIRHVPTSHVPMVSQPEATAAFIAEAVKATAPVGAR
jgi:pimeloyl-ACP methyl ester carboxylesterase